MTMKSVSTLAFAALSALVAGADLTIGGVTYKIESVEVASTNTGHTNASITASAPVPATSSGSGD